MEPLLRAINLSKSFGALAALERVSLEVYPGEVVGLAGESGSGKSALCMLLAGLHAPNTGDIYFADKRLRSPFQARPLGIEVIHQTPDLAERLDISSNIFLGSEIGWPAIARWIKIPDRRLMDLEAACILAQLNVNFSSLRAQVSDLSNEQRQMIAIARTMTRPCRLAIVDNPTILLSYPYQQSLLAQIQNWQQKGTSVIFGSDNLDHLLTVTDRIIVLHRGRQVAEYRTDEADREHILAAMVGAADRQQLTPIIWALDSYYRAREQAEKLQHNRALLEKDLAAQDTLKQEFLSQLAEQINVLDSANLALQDAQRRLLTELEQERKHLAREIHDQVIQDLLSTNYQLEEVETDEATPPALQGSLNEIRDNIRGLIDDLRHICGNLRPPTIDSLGLGAALQSYTHDWTRRTGIPASLDLDAKLGRLPEAIELSIFRIVQEGLNNVHKHALASKVQVRLKHTSPRALMVSISDNGRGLPDDFDLSALPNQGRYGLLGISERVALMGGRLRFQNQDQGGLLLQAEIPHPRVASGEERGARGEEQGAA